jgi:hypothetical protein
MKLRVILISPPPSPVLLPINGVSKQDTSCETSVQKDRVLSGVENIPPPQRVIHIFMLAVKAIALTQLCVCVCLCQKLLVIKLQDMLHEYLSFVVCDMVHIHVSILLWLSANRLLSLCF